MRLLLIPLLLLAACDAPRDVGPPVLERAPEGGQLICDPYDNAAGYQPPGGTIWALNGAARARIRPGTRWTEIPTSARAALDVADIDSLRQRALALCR